MKVIGSELVNYLVFSYTNNLTLDFSRFKGTDGTALRNNYLFNTSHIPFYLSLRKVLGIDLDQTDITNMSENFNDNYPNHSKVNGSCDIIIGSGTTPVTYEDYKIEQQIKLTVDGVAVGYDELDTSTYFIKTLTNNTEESVTINEIGVIIYCYSGLNNNDTIKNILISRDVLQEGIIVGPGETINIKLKNNNVSLEYN